MSTLFQDLRYALRQLRNSPGFTLTAVITLALGIGANTAIFTLVHGILLRSLPVADPAQLYRIGDTDDCCINSGFQNDNGDMSIFSYDLYQQLKTAAPEFEQLAAMQAGGGTFSVRRGDELAKPLHSEFVSGNYFSTLGVGAYAGRMFTANDDTEAAAPAAVISYAAWQAEFAADPHVIGETVHIQSQPFTIVGVAPPGFFGDRVTDTPTGVWLPLEKEPLIHPGTDSILRDPDSLWLYALGRLRPGTNLASLRGKLSATMQQWMYTRPDFTTNGRTADIPKQHVVLVPGGGGIQILQQQTGTGLKTLMILSCVVLLIACANIANLLLARSTARRSDVAVRMALGAGRKRLIRQALTESVLLSCLGGLAGLGVAYGGAHVILALAFPDAKAMPVEASPSLAVLGFAFLTSLFTGVLFGTAPTWMSSHAKPVEALRGANRSTRDRSSIPQKSLVVFQAALSLVLLASAGLMTESLRNLERQHFGIVTGNSYVLQLSPEAAGYTVDRLPALYRQIEDRLSALPAVASVALAMYSPLEGNNWSTAIYPQGHPAASQNDVTWATWDRVSPHFLDTIGVPILRGRGFTEQDTATSQPVAIVDQAFVKRFFPNEDPIGRHFGLEAANDDMFEIVGVFADFKINNPREPAHRLYLRPFTQQFAGYHEALELSIESRSMFARSVIVHFNRPQQDVEAPIRRTLAGIDPNLTLLDLRTLDRQVADNFISDRLIARLTSLFAILALILASVGLYGVTSYFVARRTSEVGIRMALGATRSSVVAMVLRGALWQILFGLGLGIPAALLAGHLMASQLYGVAGYDVLALATATLVLALCATAAGFLPARRAASIEPMEALRSE
ncbi:MAG: ABC transporter permease [Candidatus Sulfotelmatobacter sp.]|jgi:predicted permease